MSAVINRQGQLLSKEESSKAPRKNNSMSAKEPTEKRRFSQKYKIKKLDHKSTLGGKSPGRAANPPIIRQRFIYRAHAREKTHARTRKFSKKLKKL